MSTIYSRRDFASALADVLGLDVDRVADALNRRRISPRLCEAYAHQIVGPSEDADPAGLGLLARVIWEDLTDGAEWPWGAS